MKNTNIITSSTQTLVGASFNAVLDVDGVCLNFDAGFREVAESVLGRKLNNHTEEYDLAKKYELTKKEHDFVWREMENHFAGWAGLPLMNGADKAFQFLQSTGLKIHLVTGIEECLSGLRLHNLRDHGMIADSITCVGNGTSSKMNYIKELDPVLFVDDRLQHINEAVFVPNRVWVNLHQDQFGLQKDPSTIEVPSMNDWVNKNGKIFLEQLQALKDGRIEKMPQAFKEKRTPRSSRFSKMTG